MSRLNTFEAIAKAEYICASVQIEEPQVISSPGMIVGSTFKDLYPLSTWGIDLYAFIKLGNLNPSCSGRLVTNGQVYTKRIFATTIEVVCIYTVGRYK